MQVQYSTNPLNPIGDLSTYYVPDYLSPNKVIDYLDFNFVRPTILVVNGEAWGRDDWNEPLPNDSHVLFIESRPCGLTFLVIAVAVSVAAYVYSVMSSITRTIGDIGTPETIYSFSTGNNQLRLGKPFVEHFGRVKAFPDLIQQSFIQNIDNDQYMYFIGILGMGEYDIEGVYIENTPLTNYADSTYNIIAPGGALPSRTANIVWTCNEVSNQEVGTDYVSFIVTAPLTEIYNIEYDITFGQGLVRYDDEGNSVTQSVRVETQCRTVNNLGVSTSDWTDLESVSWSARDKDPLRYSRKIPVPLGAARYEFRIRRTNESSESSRVMDKVYLSGLRGYGGPHPAYNDVTLVEARIKATDQLNGNAASQINVVATRKLGEVTATGISATLTATRSIIDAVAYIVTADNGGQQSSSLLDWEALDALRAEFDTDSYYFDYRFNSRISVMDATLKAASCAKAVPYMPGGLFSLVQDKSQAIPSCVFTNDNIRNLKITAKPRTLDSHTCVEMTYVDPNTWDEETVICLDVSGSEDNPMKITLDGCTSRQQAYEIGMFIYYQDRLERTSVSFVTGLIGHIPPLLSKVLVPNKMIDWGDSGFIAAIDDNNIWLSDPVDFKGLSTGYLYISLADGTSGGPYEVTTTDYAHAVNGSIPIVKTIDVDGLKASRFIFGLETNDPFFIKVMGIRPQGRDLIKITGSVIEEDVYQDPGIAPTIGSYTGVSSLLGLFNISYTGEDSSGYNFHLIWSGDAASVRIELDEGAGYSILQDQYTVYAYFFVTSSTNIDVRVTPYDSDTVLQTGQAQIQNYALTVAPTGLACLADDSGLTISWDAYTGAVAYSVILEVNSIEKARQNSTETSFSVSMQHLRYLGGPWPDFTIKLSVLRTVASPFLPPLQVSEVAELVVNLSALSVPSQVDFQARLANGVSLSWTAVSDALSYVVCHETLSGAFVPSDANVVYEGTQPSAQIGGLTMTGSYTHYFKVAAQQYNHAIADLNFTTALEVTPQTDDVSVHSVNLSSGNNQNYTGPAGGSNYTYQLSGTASGDGVTVQATLTGGGTGSAYCAGIPSSTGGNTSAALTVVSSGSSNVCNVAISGGGSFSGSLIITKIS